MLSYIFPPVFPYEHLRNLPILHHPVVGQVQHIVLHGSHLAFVVDSEYTTWERCCQNAILPLAADIPPLQERIAGIQKSESNRTLGLEPLGRLEGFIV